MSLLFGGKPEEVPLRRQILRVVVFAASKASTIAIISPVFKGDHCSALPSARAYLITFAVLCVAGLPLQLFNNYHRIKSGLNPSINCDIHAGESELYAGHKIVPRQRPRLFEFDGAGRGDGVIGTPPTRSLARRSPTSINCSDWRRSSLAAYGG